MRAKAGILLIISLLFLVGAVGALDASVINPPSKDWVIANVIDQSTITVSVQNTLGPINGATVFFSVNNSIYGTMSPATVTTGPSGLATSTFTVNKKSGTAIINANISYNDGGIPVFVTKTVSQNIDHSTPYYDFIKSPPLFTYPEQGTVASQVPFKVSILDEWGNSIDNRNPLYIHTIGLHVSSALDPNDCTFVGYGQDIFLPLDSNGTLSVNVKLTSKRGDNKILMDNFEGKISFQTVWITAVAADIPYSMTGSISPGSSLPANNIEKFTIDYYLYDVYGNPIGNESIWISTNVSGETTPTLHTADTNGLIRYSYGPKISILTANITAIAKDNASVTKNLLANFISGAATNMVLAVSPQTMASREVVPTQQAFVRATVLDNFGNPVQGELVNFSLGTVNNGTYLLKAGPALITTSATTDTNGNAIVLLYPGSFAKWGEPDYNGAATGSVPIIATWNGFSQSVIATWKNYPYLNIETSSFPPTVQLNETIDITIDVEGNGFKMQGGNVAAIMDLDSSSGIWATGRMPDAKEAAKAFATAMLIPEPSGNWIGVNSFGNEKKDDHRLLEPQTVYTVVDAKIDNLVKGTNSQAFGTSIMEAINNLSTTQSGRDPDKVRAVIVLKDMGGGNLDNSQHPDKDDIILAAQGTTPKTLIFTVYYYDGVSNTTSTIDILRDIAQGTGGKFFISRDAAELKDDFLEIAEILKTTAGVNATMNLDFQQVEVNGNSTVGGDVFSYVPFGPFYDLDPTITPRDNILGRTRIMWQNSSHSVMNQSEEWITGIPPTGIPHLPNQLYFNIGTINVSQRWNTTYRLRVNQTGLINIFNCTMSASTLSYNNGTENMCLPNLHILVNPLVTTLPSGTLSVTNLIPDSGNYTDIVPMQWNLIYAGSDTVTETYWYSFKTQPFAEFGRTPGISNGTHLDHFKNLDVKKFPPGQYRIKVIASVPGIPSAEDSGEFTKPFENGTVSIQLK